MIGGKNTDQFEGTLIELSKKVFRDAIKKAGGSVPAQIATWDGKQLTLLKRPE